MDVTVAETMFKSTTIDDKINVQICKFALATEKIQGTEEEERCPWILCLFLFCCPDKLPEAWPKTKSIYYFTVPQIRIWACINGLGLILCSGYHKAEISFLLGWILIGGSGGKFPPKLV